MPPSSHLSLRGHIWHHPGVVDGTVAPVIVMFDLGGLYGYRHIHDPEERCGKPHHLINAWLYYMDFICDLDDPTLRQPC